MEQSLIFLREHSTHLIAAVLYKIWCHERRLVPCKHISTEIIFLIQASDDASHLYSIHLRHVYVCQDKRVKFIAAELMQFFQSLLYLFHALRSWICLFLYFVKLIILTVSHLMLKQCSSISSRVLTLNGLSSTTKTFLQHSPTKMPVS